MMEWLRRWFARWVLGQAIPVHDAPPPVESFDAEAAPAEE